MAAPSAEERIEKSGFALLKGDNLEVYVKKYMIELGRRSKSTKLDVVLGDNMNLSRQHAQILFDFEKGHWCIAVLGKNGVSVNGKHYGPPDTCPLASQDLINMGEQSFWFLLPRQQGGGTKRKKAATSKAKTPAEGTAKRRAPSKAKLPADASAQRPGPSEAAAQHQDNQPAQASQPTSSMHEAHPDSAEIPEWFQRQPAGTSQPARRPLPAAPHPSYQQPTAGQHTEQHLKEEHGHHSPGWGQPAS